MTEPNSIPEITAEDLLRRIEAGEAVHVLDVRAPHRLAAGYIDQGDPRRFFNVAGSQVLALDEPGAIGIDPNTPTAVVCGHGNSSRRVTAFLNDRGFQARSLQGGMAAWMMAAAPRALPASGPLDALIQFDRVGKGSLAYLLVSDGEALLIDPARHPQRYLDEIDRVGARLVGVADTHVHADYISGASALAAAQGVPYYLHPADNVHVYDGTPGTLTIDPLSEGRVIRVGRAALTVMHTPGHTEGSVTYRVDDALAFTGDFLFVRSVGRPDLGGQGPTWVQHLWQSVVRARETFAPDTMIYPAHYSTDDERQSDRSVGAAFATVAAQNAPLGIETVAEFVDWVATRQASFPDAYRTIKVVNVGLVEVSDEEAETLEVGKNECAV